MTRPAPGSLRYRIAKEGPHLAALALAEALRPDSFEKDGIEVTFREPPSVMPNGALRLVLSASDARGPLPEFDAHYIYNPPVTDATGREDPAAALLVVALEAAVDAALSKGWTWAPTR